MKITDRMRRLVNSINDSDGCLAALSLFCWICLFTIGSWASSRSAFNSAIYGSGLWYFKPLSFILAILSWTWTNLVFICLTSAVLGEIAHAWITRANILNVRAALAKGFFIFLLFLSGQIVVVGNLLANPGAQSIESNELGTIDFSQGMYVRLASTATFLSFIVCFDPSWMRTIKGIMSREPHEDQTDVKSETTNNEIES